MSFDQLIAVLEQSLPGGIDPVRVEAIYAESLAEGLVDTSPNYKIVEGILRPTAFDMEKLRRYQDEVIAMLSWLPVEFHSVTYGGGGGWTFLNSCVDRQGNQWTGLHQTQDMLIQLGIALDLAEYMGPREIWGVFPGGMPYVAITLPIEGAAE